jgi:hypothetical protein
MADFPTTHPGEVLRPKPPVTPSFAELLAGITPENLPDESFDYAALGRERL